MVDRPQLPLAFPVDPETGRAAAGAVPRRQLDIEEAIAEDEAVGGQPGPAVRLLSQTKEVKPC